MGGIATDERGRSSLGGLWAVGEVASTGLHGANRLASNSLLEAAVFGARAAADIKALVPMDRAGHFVHPRRTPGARPADSQLRAVAVAELRAIMTTYVGVVRSAKGLRTALTLLRRLESRASGDSVLSNMILTSRLVATAALNRKESRGGHFRSDFPAEDPSRASRSFIALADIEKRDGQQARTARPLALAGCAT
jgi:L-aspartate oxidase